MASRPQRPRDERLVIGITGRIGSGKTTVGKYLNSRHGFQYLRYSAVLAKWRAKDSQARLQEIGWEVMAGGMQAELNRRLIAQITPGGDVAVDGLRHPLDYESLKKQLSPSFKLLYLDSPQEQRFERLNRRGKYPDWNSFEAADSHPVEQQIESLRANAALVIQNQSSFQDLYLAVDEAMQKFRKGGRA